MTHLKNSTKINNDILVVGAGSGLGNYLSKKLNSVIFVRDDSLNIFKKEYKLIIHCANSFLMSYSEEEIYKNYVDNLKLLEISSKTKCSHFIYVSSVDVFKIKNFSNFAAMANDFGLKNTFYIHQKLISENIVIENSNCCSILRLPSLVGVGMKPNNLYRLFKENKKKLSLSKNTVLEIINYEFVKNTIIDLFQNKKFGRFVLLSKEKLFLKHLETYFKNIIFGDYIYSNSVKNESDLINYQIIKSKETSLFCIMKEFGEL